MLLLAIIIAIIGYYNQFINKLVSKTNKSNIVREKIRDK